MDDAAANEWMAANHPAERLPAADRGRRQWEILVDPATLEHLVKQEGCRHTGALPVDY